MNRKAAVTSISMALSGAALWRMAPLSHLECFSAASLSLVLGLFFSGRTEQPVSLRLKSLPRRNWHRIVLRGLVQALVVITVVLGVHHAHRFVPLIREFVADWDRPKQERRLSALEQQNEWSMAATNALTRMEQPASPTWRQALAQRAYLDDLQSVVAADSPAARQASLTRARATAVRHDIPHALVSLLESEPRLREELERASVELQLRSESLTALQTRVAAHEQRVITLSDSVRQAAEAHVADLIGWGDTLADTPPDARDNYERAMQIAQQWNVATTEASRRLSAFRSPAALPELTRAAIVGVQPVTPAVLIEVEITDATGQPIPGLSRRDFYLRDAQGRVLPCGVAQTNKEGRPLQLVIALDCSGSTKGEPLKAVQAGARLLIEAMAKSAELHLVTFAQDVKPRIHWTNDVNQLLQVVDELRADGSTALLHAIEIATQEVSRRDGPRAIVLFTDGRDTVGGPSSEELVQHCQLHNITLHAIGLATDEVDRELLLRLSIGTGGTSHVATEVTSLITHFHEVADRLQRPVYRLAVIPPETTVLPLTLRIGGANAVTLTISDIPK